MSAHDIIVDLNESDVSKSVTVEVHDDKGDTKPPTKESDKAPKRTTRAKRRTAADVRQNEHVSRVEKKTDALNDKLDKILSQSQAAEQASKISDLDSKISNVMRDYQKAITDEDAEAQKQLMERLTDLKADKKVAEAMVQQQPKEEKSSPQPDRSGDQPPPNPELARELMDLNPQIFRNPANTLEREIIEAIDRSVANDGRYDHENEDYYVELMARVKQRLPDIKMNLPDWLQDDSGEQPDEGDEKVNTRTARQSPTKSAADKRPENRRVSGSKVRLTQSDVANMKTVGLDPKNPKHVSRYAQEIAKQERGS